MNRLVIERSHIAPRFLNITLVEHQIRANLRNGG